MNLPKLKVLPDGAPMEAVTCQGKNHCADCSLHVSKGGRCEGCTSEKLKTLSENFQWCYRECNTCAGFKVKVPAICCRSPLKDIYLTAVTKGAADWNAPKYEYRERPKLSFKQRAVFYIASGGVNTIAAKEDLLVPASHEVVAVNLTRVWGRNGFYSMDLKDYLHLHPKTKLVLMTMTLDDLLERAWERESYGGDEFHAVGIDYWMPLSFSAYPEEAHMHQLYQLYRTLYATEKGEAWFTTGDHRMQGLRTDDLYLECVKKVPQVVFNTQFIVSNDNDASLKLHLTWIKHHHQITPEDVPFWFVGAATPTVIHNIRRNCGNRDLYFVSAKPLYLASKGQALALNGKNHPSKLPKYQLLQDNYEAFKSIVHHYGGGPR